MTSPAGLTLDNLTAGLPIPADPELGTPAGQVTAVEYVPCGDHPEWVRHCYYCSVRWTSVFDGLPEPRRAVLRNEHLWTDADRAVWDDTPA